MAKVEGVDIRPQYHFRKTSTGLWAWDVRRLITLSHSFPVTSVQLQKIDEIDKNHWYFAGAVEPTPRSIIEHADLMDAADLSYPIILDSVGRVMDGMHRVCKAYRLGREHIDAVQFAIDPEPDYVDCDPDELPYD
ncbi:MAG: hypothetical protein GKR90_18725 [Pseudomonadales bacterium]|nr:hypothetical protein [Pseudomonadales bacterium]